MSLTAAFQQSRRKLSTRTVKPSGNIILKVNGFTDSTVKGEVMTGPAAGSEIEIKVPDNGGRSVGVKEFTNKKHKSFVDIESGGSLRIEKVREGKDGVYDARWMRTFNGKPDPDHSVIYDAVAQLRTVRGEKQDRMFMDLVFPEIASEASSIEQLRDEIARAFEEKNGAFVFFRENGEVGSISYGRGGEKIDGEWIPADPAVAAQEVIDSFGDNLPIFEKAIAEHAFSVVPSSRVYVGTYTQDIIAEKIAEANETGEDPRISTIDPQKFRIIPTGVRVQIALNDQSEQGALPKDAADRLKDRFLETADEGAKEAFHKGGWRAVSNDDMRRFFEASGVSVTEYPENGWSRQSVLLMNGLAIKAFGQDAAVPYPNLPVCKDALQEFRTEIKEAIRSVVDGPVKVAAANKANVSEAEAPVETVTEAASEKAAPAAVEADIDDLDGLLDAVQDADMGA